MSDSAMRAGIGSIHIRTNTHTHKYTYAQIPIRTNTRTPKEADSSHLHTKDHFASNFWAKTLLSFPVKLLPQAHAGQYSKQANTKKITPPQCLPNVAQMMVSWAARVVEIGGPCNKHIPDGVSLNGERLIVVLIVIVDYRHSPVGGGLIVIRPQGTKSNR